MDFTKKLLTKDGDIYVAPEAYKTEDGINAEREVEIDYLRISEESLLNELPNTEETKEFNSFENLEARLELYDKIHESPENVKLTPKETALLLELARLKFGANVVIISRLIKELR